MLVLMVIIVLVLLVLPYYAALVLHNGPVIRMYLKKMSVSYDADQKILDFKHEFPADIEELEVERDGVNYTVYRQKNGADNVPVVVNIHGGGLVVGRRSFNRYWNALMAQQGTVVYAIDYPFVPDHSISAILNDVARQLEVIDRDARERMREYAGLCLTGDSAGAFLCFYTAAAMKNGALAECLSVRPADVNLIALGLHCGMFYTTRWDSIGLVMVRQIWGNGYRKTVGKYCDPEVIVSETKLPPMILTTAEGDYLKQYTLDFAKAAKAANQDVSMTCFESKELVHAFGAFKPEREESRETARSAAEFFREKMGQAGGE